MIVVLSGSLEWVHLRHVQCVFGHGNDGNACSARPMERRSVDEINKDWILLTTMGHTA
jgi:hypothetical protein